MNCITFDVGLKGNRFSQYKGYTFSSMVKFGNVFLGTHDTGLYKLSGYTDNSDIITSEFTIVSTDFGIRNVKDLHYVYIGLESDGDLVLTISADDKEGLEYPIPVSKTGQQTVRIKIYKNMCGRYWTLKISNPSGCKYSVDAIDVLPIVKNLYYV